MGTAGRSVSLDLNTATQRRGYSGFCCATYELNRRNSVAAYDAQRRMRSLMSNASPSHARPRRRFGLLRLPLYARVLIGVALGIALGVVFKTGPIFPGLRNDDLGQLGLLVIRLLKALAVPLILFAIFDAFLRVEISARRGACWFSFASSTSRSRSRSALPC